MGSEGAPIVDPRQGDVGDDAASRKQRSLLAIAGSLLVEISLPKAVRLDGLAAAARDTAWRRTAGGERLARHAFGTYFTADRNRLRAGAGRRRRARMDRLATVVSDCRG